MQNAHSNSQAKPKRNLAASAGRWSAKYKKTAIVGWFVFVVAALFIGGNVGTKHLKDTQLGNGESGRADAAVINHGLQAPATENVIVKSDSYVYGDPQFNKAVKAVVANVTTLKTVENVRSPLTRDGPVTKDGHTALVSFDITGKADDAGKKIDPILAKVKAARTANPQVSVQQFGDASVEKELNGVFSNDLARARNLSLPITLIILLFAFGSLVAAGIPVLLAITSVMAAVGLVALPSQLSPVDDSIAEVILLIGMAVGVDYSLFYLKREREERAAGRSESAALEAAAATSGRAVLVSGITVIAAMSGLLIAGDKTFISFGVGTMMVVAIAMVGSLTVLPALLSALGDKVEKGRVPIIGKRRQAALKRGETGGVWSWIVDRVLRRPAVSAVLATAVLIAIALPALQLNTQNSGIADLPKDLPTIKAYNAMQKAFPSKNVPAIVVYENQNVRSVESQKAIGEFKQRVANTAGLLPVDSIKYSKDGKLAELDVPIVNSTDENVFEAKTRSLRSDLIPETLGTAPGAKVLVSGMGAASIDFTQLMKSRGPIVFAFVLSLAFMLLLLTFRSIVIPIKAIVLNLLSVGAAYGVLVMVFQKGWGLSVIGFDHTTSIEPWLPLFLFVILFGLSMDYHVFILSRIREAYDNGMTTDNAVAYGIRTTAGVVTSAALVMVAVFAVFGSLSVLPLKEMGVGLSAAVLIDATIIRAVLLPSAMKLLGDANWYLPRWLEWLPRVQGESSVAPVTPPASATAPQITPRTEVAGARASA